MIVSSQWSPRHGSLQNSLGLLETMVLPIDVTVRFAQLIVSNETSCYRTDFNNCLCRRVLYLFFIQLSVFGEILNPISNSGGALFVLCSV